MIHSQEIIELPFSRKSIEIMNPEQTYRVDHIFRPLTTKHVEEYKQQMMYMEKQFLREVERFKIEGARPKPASTPIPPHTPKPRREKLNIKFEEPEEKGGALSVMEELF